MKIRFLNYKFILHRSENTCFHWWLLLLPPKQRTPSFPTRLAIMIHLYHTCRRIILPWLYCSRISQAYVFITMTFILLNSLLLYLLKSESNLLVVRPTQWALTSNYEKWRRIDWTISECMNYFRIFWVQIFTYVVLVVTRNAKSISCCAAR